MRDQVDMKRINQLHFSQHEYDRLIYEKREEHQREAGQAADEDSQLERRASQNNKLGESQELKNGERADAVHKGDRFALMKDNTYADIRVCVRPTIAALTAQFAGAGGECHHDDSFSSETL